MIKLFKKSFIFGISRNFQTEKITLKMKKLFFFIILSVCATASNAQLLWKISDNGLKESSYIFGTHHVAPLCICDSIKGFEKAFTECKQLYGEIKIDSTSNEKTQLLVSKYIMLPQDSLLNTLYSPEEYRILSSIIKKYLNADIEQLNMFKPSFISTQLSVQQSAKVFNKFDPEIQLDGSLQKKAEKLGKQVYGLETIEFQMQTVLGGSIDEQAEELIKIAKEEELFVDHIKEMADKYMQQDINALLNLMSDPKLGNTEKELDKFIFSRNRNWAELLKNILPKKSTFIVVGAGHLPGEEGLINLLRNQGYTVEPVN